MAHLLALFNLLASAQGTSVAFQRGHRVDSYRGFPLFLWADFEVRVRTEEYLLPLIIEVGTFRDLFKIFQGILPGPKQLPAWPGSIQFLCRRYFERSFRNCCPHGIR